jgi:hypothetical protein
MNLQNSGAWCRENAESRTYVVPAWRAIARKGGDPVFRDVSDGIENSRHTGYLAFAGYDGGVWRIVIARSPCDEAIQLFPCGFWIASLALAMTVLYERNPTHVMPAQAGIQYSEAPAMESKTRSVLATRLRGYDGGCY